MILMIAGGWALAGQAQASVYRGSGRIGGLAYDDATGRLVFTATLPSTSASAIVYAISYGTVDVQVDAVAPSPDSAQWSGLVTVSRGGTDNVIGAGQASADGHNVTATVPLGRNFGAYLDAGMRSYEDFPDGRQVPSAPDFVRLGVPGGELRARALTRLSCSSGLSVVSQRQAPRSCDILYPDLYLTRGLRLRALRWRHWGAAVATATAVDASAGAGRRAVRVVAYRRRACARNFIYTRLRVTGLSRGASHTYNTSVC